MMSSFFKTCLLIALCFPVIVFAKITFAASVPMVPQWLYNSPNNTDYRSFSGEIMTVNVTDPDMTLATMPRARYPADQDFTVSVGFSDFSPQGVATSSEYSESSVGMGLIWDIDGGVSQLYVYRFLLGNGDEGMAIVYSDFFESEIIHDELSSTDHPNNGVFEISKAGNSVTLSVKDTNNVVIFTKTYSITTPENDVTVGLFSSNGFRQATRVDFSNFQMNPVPVDINWTNVRNQKKEDGAQSNRVAFTILDTSGNLETSDVVDNIQLFGSSGLPISLASDGYYLMDKFLPGRYDSSTSRWLYESNFSQDSGYASSFSGDLPAGNYHLVVNLNNGLVYHRYIDYGGIKTLPFISSDSFYAYKDENGNLIISWKTPYDANFIAAQLNTALRAWIDVYQEGVLKAEIWVSAPTHIGHIFVPANVVQLYEAEGDDYQFAVQLRTTDNGNRAYSKQVPLVLSQGPQIPGDVNGNGKIGLEEAINALKVTAGQ